MSIQIEPRYTAEQYLALERGAAYKSEFINGFIYAMSGASREHNLIVGNVFREVSAQLRGRPCEAYVADMRVKVSATGMYTYPDIAVVCGEPHFEDTQVDTLTNPSVIIEVLSPSTEAYDRGAKFTHYRRIASLEEYVLIAQDRISAERFVRQGDSWLLTDAVALTDRVHLASIRCDLTLSDIYDKIRFATDDETSSA